MTKIQKYRPTAVLFSAFVLALASLGFTQDAGTSEPNLSQADAIEVPTGQQRTIQGVILTKQNDDLFLRGFDGGLFNITLAGTEVKERKKNPFRGAKQYTYDDLIPGLPIEVKGVGDSTGSLVAREIRFRNDDLKVARTMDTRVVPIENSLKEAEARLDESETNAQRLSGQVRELTAITDLIRDSAETAQESADDAMAEANKAQSLAGNANEGVRVTNERITSLDNYEVMDVVTVLFRAGSSTLSEEAKSELDTIAEQAANEMGFFLEVTGFASSDGDQALNRRLSQRRAETVTQYLADFHSMPLRRFIMPMGYGENRPIADNSTRAGREQNRRVEIRMLVNKGLRSEESSPQTTGSDISQADPSQ